MKNKLIYTSILICLFSSKLLSQNASDIIFRAMETEAKRAVDSLQMAGVPNPFFLSYSVTDKELLEVKAVLGAVVYSKLTPRFRNISVKPLVGDYRTTNVVNFSNDFTSFRASAENNESQIRRDFWIATDAAYKEAAATYRQKTASGRSGSNFPDFLKTKPFVRLNTNYDTLSFDQEGWELKTKELSAIFLEYPEIVSSSVSYKTSNTYYYHFNTEGTKFVQPAGLSVLTITASIKDGDGQTHKDKIEYIASSDKYLPEMRSVKESVRKLAASLKETAEATDITEYYSGPVLFEDQAVLKLFMENLVMKNGIIAKRDNINLNSGASRITKIDKSLVSRIGKKIIDQKITIKDISNNYELDRFKIPGYTNIDAEGVEKSGEITLIEKGLLKRMISGRMPADSGMESTGSLRFNIIDRHVSYSILPTALHIKTENGKSNAQIKRVLLKSAASEGLKYAYIVRRYPELRDDLSPKIYRVDVKTGNEILVKSATILTIMNATILKRIKAVSAKEQIQVKMYDNYPITVYLPYALILDDIELNLLNYNKQNKQLITNPLQRH